ncbi:MAG: hypothetical protein ACYDG2_12340 [Ruminiclostridium sp.]
MRVQLLKADANGCCQIYQMQIKAFAHLLDKYHDYTTNPGAEPLERIIQRMEQTFTDYYFIQLGSENIGAIRVVRLHDGACRISPMFILPEFQGKGYGPAGHQECRVPLPRCLPLGAGYNKTRAEAMLSL